MTQNNFVVVVKGLILNHGKTLIIKRDNKALFGGGTWELVGGKIGFGEDLEPALVREIKEEVGLNIEVERILYATSFSEPLRQVVILTYLCKSVGNNMIKLSEEHTEFKWATKEELKDLLPINTIRDFKRHNVFSIIEMHK